MDGKTDNIVNESSLLPSTNEQNTNNDDEFSARKKYASHLLDIALLMANISQLKAVLDGGESYKYYHVMLGLISSSITLQIIFAFIMIVITSLERRIKECRHGKCHGPLVNKNIDLPLSLRVLDNIGLFLVLIVIILNASISAFGLTGSNLAPRVAHNNTI